MPAASVTLSRFKEILNYNIDNNVKLQENGLAPIALNLIGEKGIGKTSTIRQVAEERGMTLVKLNLGQIDEVGD